MPTHVRRRAVTPDRSRTATVRPPHRTAALALGLGATLLALSACASGEPEEPATVEATPATGLPAATDLADPAEVVPAGEWGVVEVPETAGSKNHIPVAVKITSVTKGEPAELKDVTSVTGGNEQLQSGTPWYITVHWSALEGDGWDSPIQGIWGWSSSSDTGAMRLSLPASQLRCAEPTTTPAGGAKLEQVSCAAAMFEDPATELDQVRFLNATTYPGQDNGIRFAVPAS